MALTLTENSRPQDFTGQGDALLSPYMKSFARELGGTPARRMVAAKDLVKSRFCRTRMSQLFGLVPSQMETVLRDVGVEDAVSWREMLEEGAGFQFAQCAQPRSALVTTIVHGHAAQGVKTVVRENTVSDQLGHAACGMVQVPDKLFGLVTTAHGHHLFTTNSASSTRRINNLHCGRDVV